MESASWTQELLGWVNANPGWGALMVFLVAMVESLVLIGILLPGIMILFGVGTLIGLGVMDLLPVWLAASSGAFVGDTVSFALGYRNREHLLDIWPFSRYPGLMERGIRFFQAHGVKSVVAGRFIGPLRPIIPAVAGILRMPGHDGLAVICSIAPGSAGGRVPVSSRRRGRPCGSRSRRCKRRVRDRA